jgi:hypothetical protein
MSDCTLAAMDEINDNDNGGEVVSRKHRQHFTPQKHYYFSVSGTNFC